MLGPATPCFLQPVICNGRLSSQVEYEVLTVAFKTMWIFFSSKEKQFSKTKIINAFPTPPHFPRVWVFVFFPPYSKISMSHLVIITSDFFDHFFLSSFRPFVQKGWVQGQKNFHTKSFSYNLTRRVS